MLEVILDTETTGLSNTEKHRIVEIGCIELSNQIPTNKIFHEYINPQIVEKFKKLQLPVELKKKQADYIIKNNFRNNSTTKYVKKIVKKILLNA